MAEQPDQVVDTRTLIILAFSATAGVLVEFYDFFIYGYAAASAFPSIFFPKLPPTQALVFSYLAFGAAFPARLLGAFIFGHFGDRAGRKYAFLINILIVGVTTCLTGLLPGYGTLGIAAPIVLVLLRILQGIGLGGEFGGGFFVARGIWRKAAVPGLLDVSRKSWHPLGRYDRQCCSAYSEQDLRDHGLADCYVALRSHRAPRNACTLQACRYSPLRAAETA